MENKIKYNGKITGELNFPLSEDKIRYLYEVLKNDTSKNGKSINEKLLHLHKILEFQS